MARTHVAELHDRTRPRRPVLIVPGLRNSGPEHWQDALAGAERVEQVDWDRPTLGAWVTTRRASILTSRRRRSRPPTPATAPANG
jgi:hypothetical protein